MTKMIRKKHSLRVIFCSNQISLCIAVSLAEKEKPYIDTVIFFDGLRCDTNIFDGLGIKLHHFSRWGFFKFLMSSLLKRPEEVCVPHFKGGRIIRIYASYAKKVSAVDDGLDTFRENPRNIMPSDFEEISNYYTFKYDVRLASWLEHFNLIKVCDVSLIGESGKKIINLNDFDAVLVESPGVESVKITDSDFSNIFLVKHSNPNKNIKALQGCTSSVGSDFALEKSLEKYKKTIVVGESMTAVYCLLVKEPSFKLIVAIQEKNFKNMPTLVQLVENSKHAVIWHKG